MKESLILAQQLDSKYEIARIATQVEGNFECAVRLYWASKNSFDSISAWRQEYEFENPLLPCRAALSKSEFVATEQHGRAMMMEQANTYALEDQD